MKINRNYVHALLEKCFEDFFTLYRERKEKARQTKRNQKVKNEVENL
jgi:hypothetical protein